MTIVTADAERPARYRSFGRRGDRFMDEMRARVFQRPPEIGPDGQKTGKATLPSLQQAETHGHIRAEAFSERGVEPRGCGEKWQPNYHYVGGDRVLPLTRNGWEYVCVVGGQTHEAEPGWVADAVTGSREKYELLGKASLEALPSEPLVKDGQVVWLRRKTWTGRPGYGSFGMGEICRAMAMHPYALETGEDRRKVLRAGRLLRKTRNIGVPVQHTPASRRPPRPWRVARAARLAAERKLVEAFVAANDQITVDGVAA